MQAKVSPRLTQKRPKNVCVCVCVCRVRPPWIRHWYSGEVSKVPTYTRMQLSDFPTKLFEWRTWLGFDECVGIMGHLNYIMGFSSSFPIHSKGKSQLEVGGATLWLLQLLLGACNLSYRLNLGTRLETELLQFSIDLFTDVCLRVGTENKCA